MSTNVPGHEGIGRVVQGKFCLNLQLRGDILTTCSWSGYDRGHDGEACGREVPFPYIATT